MHKSYVYNSTGSDQLMHSSLSQNPQDGQHSHHPKDFPGQSPSRLQKPFLILFTADSCLFACSWEHINESSRICSLCLASVLQQDGEPGPGSCICWQFFFSSYCIRYYCTAHHVWLIYKQLCCFQLLGLMNNVLTNMLVKLFLWACFLSLIS